MIKKLGLPEELISHLETFNNPKILDKELKAFDTLASRYSQDQIIEVLSFLKDNGIPPYGKICLYPLIEMNENPELMSMFDEHHRANRNPSKDVSIQTEI